jgi:hypothetical protein
MSRYIAFNVDMVRAILDEHKDVTRRPVRPQPDENGLSIRNAVLDDRLRWVGEGWCDENWRLYKSPFGESGSRLWVREKARIFDYVGRVFGPSHVTLEYVANSERRTLLMPPRIRTVPIGKCVPNGCFREAARLFLEVASVTVERIRDITHEEAKREGFMTRKDFGDAWDSIYPGSWERNEWVWRCEFKRVTT